MRSPCLWRRVWPGLGLLACLGLGEVGRAETALEFQPVGTGTALVADPAASEGTCVAMAVGDKGEGTPIAWGFSKPLVTPGLYRVALRLRLLCPADFDRSRLRVSFAVSGGGQTLDFPSAAPFLDGKPGAYTELVRGILWTRPGVVKVVGRWSVASVPPGQRQVPARPVKLPSLADHGLPGETSGGTQDADELAALVAGDVARPVAEIQDPVVLVDRLTLEPLSHTLVVEKVWPEKVHVYPGEPNPVTATVRNLGAGEIRASLQFDMLTGLDETGSPMRVELTIPGNGTASHRFDWTSGLREYGHEARVTVLVGDRPVHAASEYFTVSTPIWKTAIQGSGFIDWYGRENDFAQHVSDNRRAYINVEEAFSWQPSSWTDLNPTNADWWAGQNNFHNSLAGLEEWIARSHSNGIKMITYSWPTASGKAGIEWGRRYPDLLTRESGTAGFSTGMDLEDLRLFDLTHGRPELWDYQSGIWQNMGINLGFLRSMHLHVKEVIRSARRFGWDGLRFDYPPRWSPMGTGGMRWEIEQLGVMDLMRELLPEYIDTTNAVWSAEAISVRNARYARHVLRKELGPNFALSYNDGGLAPVTEKEAFYFREYCREGGQIMNEAIRGSSAMSNYLNVVLWHHEAARTAGGYDNVFEAEKSPAPLASIYSAVFTFAVGSHPYLDYGWRSMPGEYTQLMTRFGEYGWDLALEPVDAERAGVTVDEGKAPLLWKPFLRQRRSGRALETVVHLVNPPEWDPAKAVRQYATEWRTSVVVHKRAAKEPRAWCLTAEPSLSATALPVRAEGGGYAVTVPEVRYWTLVVWSETP